MKGRPRSRAVRLRIILAFYMALIYYTQDFRVYEETRDQPMPGPFPAPPIFWGKSPGDEVGLNYVCDKGWQQFAECIEDIKKEISLLAKYKTSHLFL